MSEIAFVQGPVVDFAKRRGWLCRKMKYEGRVGCPDYWFFRDGEVLIIEFKKPGERPSVIQAREHGRLRAEKFFVHVVDNPETGRELLW